MDINSISDIGSLYSDYANILTTRASDVTSEGVARKIKDAASSKNDEELMKACKSFESYLVEQLMSSMEELGKVPGQDDDEGEYTDMFKDTFRQSLAETVSSSSDIGIAKMFYESMRREQEVVASMDDTVSETADAAATLDTDIL